MGNNAPGADFETIVINLYDENCLSKNVLNVIGEVFVGSYSDIDLGGNQDLVTKDGKGLEQVVVEIMRLGYAPKPGKNGRITWYYAFANILAEWSGEPPDYDWDEI